MPDVVRQDLGAAGVLVQAALLAGFALFGLLRGPLPFGLAATAGIGWSIHLRLGAIVLAGVLGLLLDALVHAVARSSPARPVGRSAILV